MAYYAALVSTIQLLEEMSLSEHQYPNSLFEKQQITTLFVTLTHLQELLEDYTSLYNKEAVGFLDRIRDVACLAQDLIECQIPDEARQAREIIECHIPDSDRGGGDTVEWQLPTAQDNFESRIPNAAKRAKRTNYMFNIPDAVNRAKRITESEISDRIGDPTVLEVIIHEIVHAIFWYFVSACHNSENVNENIVLAIGKGYQDLLKLTKQLESILSKGYQDLKALVKVDDSIDMGKGCLDLMKFKEELDSIVLKGYQDLMKLKEELDANGEKGYQDWRVREVVDSIVGRGNQVIDRVKEEIDVAVRKGYKYVLAKIKKIVDSVVLRGHEDIARMKVGVDSIVGRGYQDSKRLKNEVNSIVVKGYQNLVELKKELRVIVRRGNQNMKKEIVDYINVGREYPQDLKSMKEEVDSVVKKIYKDHLGKEVVGSIVGRGYQVLERVREEINSIIRREYHDWERVKREVDYIVVKGYQDIVKLKKELDAIRKEGNQDFECVKEVFDITTRRGYEDLETVKEEVDFTVEKGYKDMFEKVKEEVGSIVENLTRVKEEGHSTHQDDLQVSVGASTQGPSDGACMVGFEEHLKRIKEQLFGESSDLKVISVEGMGGIGKSTLARNIFDDKVIDDHFDFRIWVTISQNYHLRNILLAIADSLNMNKEELHGVGGGELKQNIYQYLFGKRYLIIMDDVWDTKIWDDFKWIFPNGTGGSRIIITTRQSNVASLASASDFINQIPLLEYDQSWDLFRDKVLCPPELEDIGRSIVRNCGGLPLAIVVVAGLLSKVNTTRSDWEEVARNLSSIASTNDERFSKILSLSYNYLPHHLKPCFLYFGGFPEDYEISVSKLVKLWVAEGFIKPSTSKSFEGVAEEYLEELVERNLVSITKWRSNGKFRCCNIHDLLRDLCSERARHEHFLLLVHKHSATGHIHRFFIHSDSSSDIPMQENHFLHVRSFLSFGNKPSQVSSHLSNFKPLRVLDAPYADFNFSPDAIFELLHLRYLVLLCRESGNILSSVFKLQNLQTLIVVSSVGQTFSLPSEIWKMPQLRHVMIGQVELPPIPSGVRIIPETPLLGKLQTLCRVVDFRFNSSTVAMIPNLKKLKLGLRDCERHENHWDKYCLENLIDLHQLETLDIYFLKGFTYAEDHHVTPFPDIFSFPSNLKKLSLRGCKLPWADLTIVGTLPNLQVLKLKWKSFVGGKWEPVEGEFTKLKFLLVERLYDLENWETERAHFPCLEQLHIRYCEKLKIPTEVGNITTLELIELRFCSSFMESCAREIQQEQEEVGNYDLQVRCIRK